MSEHRYHLSIVIPAYNEERRLPVSLPKIADFVLRQDYRTEVVIVNDGSVDRTLDVVRQFQSKYPFIGLVDAEHGGKGHAVRAGMLQARGEYLFLCDSDLSMPIEEVRKFLPPACEDCDIAIGSREVVGALRIGEPLHRHVMGRIYNYLVSALLVRGIKDTQAGFKCFTRAAARELFGMQTISGWGFDVELLYLAQRQGMQIREVPITWYFQHDSRVQPFRDSYRMLCEILRIRSNALKGVYDKGARISDEVGVNQAHM